MAFQSQPSKRIPQTNTIKNPQNSGLNCIFSQWHQILTLTSFTQQVPRYPPALTNPQRRTSLTASPSRAARLEASPPPQPANNPPELPRLALPCELPRNNFLIYTTRGLPPSPLPHQKHLLPYIFPGFPANLATYLLQNNSRHTSVKYATALYGGLAKRGAQLHPPI